MARKRYTAEQIIQKLREVEVALSKGQSAGEACKKIGVTEPTHDRWRKENTRLKNLVAKSELDKEILTEAASGNF
jgi:transposase-like protein